MKKNILKNIIIIFILLFIIWSVMVITDYTRAKDLKKPIFALSTASDQNGNGFYKCIGYEVRAVTEEFNNREYILYDMPFSILGKTISQKNTMYDNYHHNPGLLGVDKETVLKHFEALSYVNPDVSGKQEIYTEYIKGNDVKVMNMIIYNGIVAGFEYEYHNLQAAFDFAKYLRKDFELTYGEKSTYPGMIQSGKDYFDNLKNASELKPLHKYYEDWTPGLDYKKKENIDKMLDGKACSRVDIRFELSVVDENKAIVSVRYIALP